MGQMATMVNQSFKNIMNKFKNWLKLPYPLLFGMVRDYRQIAVSSIFIAILLYAIRPFGLSTFPSDMLAWFVAQLALGSIVVSVIVTQIMPRYLCNEDQWQIWKQVVLTLSNFLLVALYLQFMVLDGIDTVTLATYLGLTILLATGPLMVRLLITQNSLLQANLKQAGLSNLSLDSNKNLNRELNIKLNADDGEQLNIIASGFDYAKAEKNYVEIFWRDGHQVKTNVLRMAFATLKQQLSLNKIVLVHCHRSYLASQASITKVIGNSRGYSLELNNGA